MSLNKMLGKQLELKRMKRDLQLICLNINNYMGGRTQPYLNSNKGECQEWKRQAIDDGEVEFCSFSS